MTCYHDDVPWSEGETEYHPRGGQVTIRQDCPDCGSTLVRHFSYTGTVPVEDSA